MIGSSSSVFSKLLCNQILWFYSHDHKFKGIEESKAEETCSFLCFLTHQSLSLGGLDTPKNHAKVH